MKELTYLELSLTSGGKSAKASCMCREIQKDPCTGYAIINASLGVAALFGALFGHGNPARAFISIPMAFYFGGKAFRNAEERCSSEV